MSRRFTTLAFMGVGVRAIRCRIVSTEGTEAEILSPGGADLEAFRWVTFCFGDGKVGNFGGVSSGGVPAFGGVPGLTSPSDATFCVGGGKVGNFAGESSGGVPAFGAVPGLTSPSDGGDIGETSTPCSRWCQKRVTLQKRAWVILCGDINAGTTVVALACDPGSSACDSLSGGTPAGGVVSKRCAPWSAAVEGDASMGFDNL